MNRRHLLFLLSAGTFLAPFAQTIYAPSMVAVRDSLHTTNLLAGASIAVYGLFLALMQLVYGPLVDTFPGKRVIMAGLSVYLAGAGAAFFASSIELLILARAIQAMGVASAMVVGPSFITDLFPPQERGRALGVYQSVLLTGTVVGPLAGGLIGPTFGWRYDFAAVALAGILVLLAMARWLPLGRPAADRVSVARAVRVLHNPATRAICLLGFAQFFCIHGFLGFIPVLFVERVHLDERWIAFTLMAMTVAQAGGSPLGGRLADRRGRRSIIVRAAFLAALAAGSIGVFAFLADSPIMGVPLALGLATLGLSFALNFPAQVALMVDWYPGLRGTTVGLYNLGRFLGGALGPLVIGLLADRYGISAAISVPSLVLLAVAVNAAIAVAEPAPAGVRREA